MMFEVLLFCAQRCPSFYLFFSLVKLVYRSFYRFIYLFIFVFVSLLLLLLLLFLFFEIFIYIARLHTKTWVTQILIFIWGSQLQLAIWLQVWKDTVSNLLIHRFILKYGLEITSALLKFWPIISDSQRTSNYHRLDFSCPQQTTLKTCLFAKIYKNIMEGMIWERKDTAVFRSTCFKTRTCSHHNFCAFETERKHSNNINWNIYLKVHVM